MRQIFTSARLENVEGVAKLLGEHDIQTRITNGRSYKGNRRKGFSYTDRNRDTRSDPILWIVFPNDQPKARQLLREAGLMDTTRTSYLPDASRPAPLVMAAAPKNLAARARMAMLFAVVLLAGITVMRTCQKPEPAPIVQPIPAAIPEPAPPAEPEDDPDRHIVPIDTSLF